MKYILILIILPILILFSSCEIKEQEITESQPWITEELYTSTNLHDVFFLNDEYGWIVGDNGTIFKFAEQRWHRVLVDISDNLSDVHIVDYDNTWIIGDNSTILNFRADTFTRYSCPISQTLNDIYMIDSTIGWIIGTNGTMLEFANDEWIIYNIPGAPDDLRNVHLNQIYFYNDSNGIIVGDYRTIIKYRREWQHIQTGNIPEFYTSICLTDINNYFLGWVELGHPSIMSSGIYSTQHGSVYHNDNAVWITSIEVKDNNGWAIIGQSGKILKFNGTRFNLYKTIEHPLGSMFMLNDTLGWIVGGGGTLLKY